MPIIKEVRDRKLPPNLDPECKRSQAQGSSEIGHNAKSHAQDMHDFGMAVDTTGREKAQTPDPAKDGVTGVPMPPFLGHRKGK